MSSIKPGTPNTFFQELVEQSLDAIIVVAPDGTLLFLNNASEKLSGLPPEQMRGRNVFEFVHLEDHAVITEALGRALRGCIPRLVECRFRHADDSWRVLEVMGRASPLTNGIIANIREITGRKRLEAELSRLATIVECSEDAIFSKDLDNKFTSWNRGAEQLFGYTAAETIGQDIQMIVPPEVDDQGEITRKLDRAERISRYETVRKRKDGTRFHVSLSASPLISSNGALIGACGIAHDVTPRHEAIAQLKSSEERYRQILDLCPDAIFLIQNARFTFTNAAGIRLLCATAMRDIVGRSVFDVFSPACHTSIAECFARVLDQHRPPSAEEKQLLRFDGTLIEVEVLAASVNVDGPDTIQLVVRDITERKRSEETLRQSDLKFRRIVEHAPYGIFRATIEGMLMSANPALVQMLGYESESDLLRVPLADIYVDPRARHRLVEQCENGGAVKDAEFKWRRKDGSEIYVLLNGRLFMNDSGAPEFETFVRDISERRNIENQLRQAQKMEAIGRFSAGVAHDFNNLLMIISSYSEMLEHRLSDDNDARKMIGRMRDACTRGAALTNHLLAFSRQQMMLPKVLDLNEVIASLGKILPRLLGEDIEVIVHLCPGVARVKLDATQIDQVLMNLAVNARDAMPNGGKLILETRKVTLDSTYTRSHRPMKEGSWVLLSVSDTGMGIPKDIQSKIFEPFFTTKENGRGTGLGLSIAYGIVRQSGGHIWVYSEEGLGTTFKMYFPQTESAPPVAVHSTDRVSPSIGSETVLLVEDEDNLREAVKDFLTQKGYTVISAGGPLEALQLTHDSIQNVDLLITDMVMPGMKGSEMALALRRDHPRIKTIYMSGYSEKWAEETTQDFRADAYMQKPFRLSDLAAVIRQILEF